MKTNLLSVVLSTALCAPLVAHAQRSDEPPVKLQPGDTRVPGQCLSQQEFDLNAALDALTRPTHGYEFSDEADDVPRFDPHEFVGTWTIDGVLPDTALGPAGEVAGVETIQHVEDCVYQSVTSLTMGDDVTVTVQSLIVYDRAAAYMVRLDQDSRGFRLLKTGRFGGDPGGYHSHHWDTPPFTYQGRQVRMRGTTFFPSPGVSRLRTQISEDGQPFVNYGTLWWRREAPSP